MQDLEFNGLVESIDDLHPVVIVINEYMLLIIGSIYLIPVTAYSIVRSKRSPTVKKNELTEPLLESK